MVPGKLVATDVIGTACRESTKSATDSFRDGLYTYHRLGLDVFAANPLQVRKQTLDLLTTIRTIGLQLPNSVLINSFFDAKSQELNNILYEGTPPNARKLLIYSRI